MSRYLGLPSCALACALLNTWQAFASEPEAIHSSGATSLHGEFGKSRVDVLLSTHQVPVEKLPPTGSSHRVPGCTYSREPCVVLDSMDLRVDGRTIVVPNTVLASLSDLFTMAMESSGNSFVLILKGGDASEAYVVRLTFDHRRLLSRTLSSGLAADEELERTTYFEQKSSFD